jgi:hypothetical protein
MLTWDDACHAILADSKANGYAKAYAKAGLGMTGRERGVQALYILNNLTHWRAPIAKEVRKVLKEASYVRI